MGHIYTIRVKEQLDPSWSARFAGLAIRARSGAGTTMRGQLPDQAALLAVLIATHDLGLTLIAVRCETCARPSAQAARGSGAKDSNGVERENR